MRNKRKRVYFVLIFIVIVVVVFMMRQGKKGNGEESIAGINPVYGNMQRSISTTGEVEPQNRLEIKPPIGGRIEEVLVREGDKVTIGDILALMSSTDRAALLDAAYLQNEEELEYWKKVYNSTPLISPINGEVIVRSVEPGQTVTATDAVIVLSDRLIVQADVDETDIGEVKTGCKAEISLDAYPEIRVGGVVDHISYESTLVNNVTIYEVDILPDSIPGVFRSGMSANVDIVTEYKKNVLLVPLSAVTRNSGESFVLLKQETGETVRQRVETGLSDDENIEIVSGLSIDDIIVVSDHKYSIPENKELGGNPFMPRFNRKKK